MPIFMNERFNTLTRDRIVKISNIASVFLLVLSFMYIVFVYSQLPPLIPVFNQLPWGIERLGSKIMIFLPLVINAVVLFINLLFSQMIYEKMPLVVRMMSITALFVSFITLMFVVRTTILLL